MKKLTTKDFIKRAKSKWGDKYDYSKVKYINMKTKVDLICENNHIFKITPDNLIRGRGCFYCSNRNDSVNDLESFVKKSNKIHKNYYSYNKFRYINSKTKSIIICPEHGEFKQTPNLHLSGSGCKECYYELLKCDTSHFIKKSKKIHNNFYNYSKSVYINSKSLIVITCPEHGDFKQTPSVHLSGSGCKKCMIKKLRRDYNSFLKVANKIHENFYKYKKDSYGGMRKKIIIVCPKHGDFKMTPDNHISKKQGCKYCGNNVSKLEKKWLDELNISKKNRQVRHYINRRLFKFDGFNECEKIIYEFYGDFWHGNLNKYKKGDVNPVTKTTFKYLNDKTKEREEYLKSFGYKVVSIWESEYKKINKE